MDARCFWKHSPKIQVSEAFVLQTDPLYSDSSVNEFYCDGYVIVTDWVNKIFGKLKLEVVGLHIFLSAIQYIPRLVKIQHSVFQGSQMRIGQLWYQIMDHINWVSTSIQLIVIA